MVEEGIVEGEVKVKMKVKGGKGNCG